MTKFVHIYFAQTCVSSYSVHSVQPPLDSNILFTWSYPCACMSWHCGEIEWHPETNPVCHTEPDGRYVCVFAA